jgi:hypothetical protein
MIKRLHDKKAGVAILISLIIISLAEVLFRSFVMKEAMLTTANLGEQVAIIALALTILILTARGKDRVCYLLFAAWIGYFVLDQMFELPGVILKMAVVNANPIATVSSILRILTMICIVIIGGLIVEYMSDGTICNRAFNTLCLITIMLLACDMIISVTGIFNAPTEIIKMQTTLVLFNNLYRITMIFLFSFFAYDSAKMQLKKTDLSNK